MIDLLVTVVVLTKHVMFGGIEFVEQLNLIVLLL